MTKYYPNLIKYIKTELKNKFPKIKPKEDLENMPANLLWMMDKMQTFDDVAKRGRWIGWVMANAEMLGVLTNKQSRKLSKKDSDSGFI